MEALIQRLHRVDNSQPGAHGPLRIVLVGLGHAEEADQAVAEKLIDVAPKASDRVGGGLLVRFRDPMPIFGIESRRDLGGANQVAEEHRELAPLAVGGGGRRSELAVEM